MNIPIIGANGQQGNEMSIVSKNTICDIHPCRSAESASPVKRPSFSVLEKMKVKGTFDIKVPNGKDSLHKCSDGWGTTIVLVTLITQKGIFFLANNGDNKQYKYVC